MVTAKHVPVLVDETLQALAIQPGGRYIDCTVGGGGHAAAILERSAPGGQLLGIEADPEALEIARGRLAPFGNAALLVNDNFVNLKNIGREHGFWPVHGILFDLGLSTIQLESRRGFSFQTDDPLDMRISPGQELSAAGIVNTLPESELANLIWRYGEEPDSRRIARVIIRSRPITTTGVRAIEKAAAPYRGKIHPATRTFQALRIAVNQELENIPTALEQAIELLGYEGHLVVITYHSLEDRLVKQFLQREARGCICPPGLPACVCGHTPTLRLINRRVITPTPAEIAVNPRARSAKLRAAERIIRPVAVTDDNFSRALKLKGQPPRRRSRETPLKIRVANSSICQS
jgi:16S rRNA (cytosine1402-N4)-methyltransferase